MRPLLKLLFAILCSAFFLQLVNSAGQKQLYIRKWSSCRGKNKLPMIWKDLRVGRDNQGNTIVDLTVDLTKEVSNALSITFNIWKCDAAGNPDSCEFVVKDYTNTEICELIDKKNSAWEIFIEHFDKKPVCPIQPGVYKIVKMPVKTDFMKFLPISDAVWKIKLEGYDNKAEVSCVELEMVLSSKRQAG